jgi:ATP-dependent protease HslVU (ClpYQ) peptidase subunit
MTTIAWDGQSLAIDSQFTDAGLRTVGIKARKLSDGTVLAFCGTAVAGYALVAWYEQGAEREKWPHCQTDNETSACLIVAKDGQVAAFERGAPFAIPCHEPFMAWGSGRDYALGAMAMGASAEKAVRVAIKFDTSSGGRVRVFRCGAPEAA